MRYHYHPSEIKGESPALLYRKHILLLPCVLETSVTNPQKISELLLNRAFEKEEIESIVKMKKENKKKKVRYFQCIIPDILN